MNFRTTLILLVLLTAGLVVVFFAQRAGDEDDRPPQQATVQPGEGRRLLPDMKVDEVNRLVIRPTAEGQKPLELVKSDGKWKLTQPNAWEADDFEARNLVQSVVEIRSRGQIEPTPENRSGTGIDKPRYVIEAADGSRTVKLTVGEQSALGNDLYLTTSEGGPIQQATAGRLASRLEDGIDELAKSLRDKQLVDVSSYDVKQAKITRRGQTLTFVKQGEDWKITEPKEAPADTAEVTSLLSSVANLRAEEFVEPGSPELAGALLDDPRATVWLSTEASATQPAADAATQPAGGSGTTLIVGQFADVEKSRSYVKVGDVVAKVPLGETAWTRISEASPLTLRDRRVLDIEPNAVTKLTISRDLAATTQPSERPAEQSQIVLARRQEQLAPAGPPAPPRPESSGEPPPAPPQPTEATPQDEQSAAERQGEVILASGRESVTPESASEQPGQAPADDAAVQPTSPPTLAEPNSNPTAGEAPPQAEAAPSTGPSTAPVDPPSQWVLESEPKGDADDSKVQALLTTLNPLRVQKYLESMPQDLTPSGTYVLTVETESQGDSPAQTHEVRVIDPGGERNPIGEYAGFVFELDRRFLENLQGDFAKKPNPPAPPLPA